MELMHPLSHISLFSWPGDLFSLRRFLNSWPTEKREGKSYGERGWSGSVFKSL